MAAKSTSASRKRTTGKSNPAINEGELNKGQLRKLNALRKSLGEDIADKAFAQWLKFRPVSVEEVDTNAELIANSLFDQVNKGNLRIPRGGYLVRRGRGRVIVERGAE